MSSRLLSSLGHWRCFWCPSHADHLGASLRGPKEPPDQTVVEHDVSRAQPAHAAHAEQLWSARAGTNGGDGHGTRAARRRSMRPIKPAQHCSQMRSPVSQSQSSRR